ncbi:MAG: endonuclease [Muribaculaceae bacterium]|nr:endonuclease [Muribaculaceae bacterium]
MKRLFSYLVAMTVVITASAAIPTNYYKSCEGKTGEALLQSLCSVISGHTQVSYKGLWDMYYDTDVKANGKIWDMYSNVEFTPGTDQCGTYSYVGDCYNREHSFPKSWFSDASPMYTEAFHVYPTDGRVNGQRSNYPFGECANGERLSHNNYVGAGKLGACTFEGYSGTVFEPDDVYKGDFARSYLYMAARYYNEINTWDSDMLAGNHYPAFSSWAVNLLMKWTRQDPVSEKETNRNEIIYADYQHNRNPFIDYPELAEYIWGNKVGTAWYPGGVAEPEINTPVDGSSIDFGTAAINRAKNVAVNVLATNLTENVTVTVNGVGFYASTNTITAAQAMAGYELTVSFLSATERTSTGTLTLTSGTASATVRLSARALSGLPAGPAVEIGATTFVATWSNVDDASAQYSLTVKQGGIALDGYPVNVSAAAERYTVTDLQPSTTYTYVVASSILTSNEISVTTSAAIPEIDFSSDDDLSGFVASPDNDSPVATIDMFAQYIENPITISVNAPFLLSDDNETWSTSITVSPDEETIFVKMGACAVGQYTSILTAQSGEYLNDSVELAGVSSEASYEYATETFDSEYIATNINKLGSYTATLNITGSAFTWELYGGGFWNTDVGHGGEGYAPRFGTKVAAPTLTVTQELSQGIGVVSFYARKWSASENATTLNVQYSTDGGATWLDPTSGSVDISSVDWTEYNVTINVAKSTGNRAENDLRVRFARGAGARFFIDDISITGYVQPTSVEPVVDESKWIAYCRRGEMVIENANPRAHVDVYSVDGRTAFAGKVSAARGLSLPAGLYIVVIDDVAHRVLIK